VAHYAQMMSKPEPGTAAPDPVYLHPAVVRVRLALEGLGATGRIRVLDEHARTAALAADQLGVEVGAIANSLVFALPDPHSVRGRSPLLVLTSGAHRVDTGHVADQLGVERLEQADADFVRASTGFVIGGVPPVGHPHPLRTLVDVTLASYQQVWAAAGHPKAVFPTHYDELLRITAGHPVEVT